MQRPNYYDILKIFPDAPAEVIRAAYRSLSRKHHPDNSPDSGEARDFKQVQKAWEVLSDPEKRRQYDEQLGRAGREPEDVERRSPKQLASVSSRLPPDVTVMKIDGTSSFLTLSEHFKRKWKDAAGCDLSGMVFDGVSFRGAPLTGATLDGSSFIGCDFRDADLTDCSARNCDFHGAQFSGANLERTRFSGSNLQNSVFLQAHVIQGSTHKDLRVRFTSLDTTIHTVDSSVKTRPTLVTSVDFGECDLRGAEFCLPPIEATEAANDQLMLGTDRQVSLYLRQKFSFCRIRESNFAKSNLRQLDLHGLDLKGCSFTDAHLQGVNFEESDIQDLDLSSCNLVNANLHKVKYNNGTQFPEGYPIPSDAVEMERENADHEKKGSDCETQYQHQSLGTLILCVIVIVVVTTGFLLLIR